MSITRYTGSSNYEKGRKKTIIYLICATVASIGFYSGWGRLGLLGCERIMYTDFPIVMEADARTRLLVLASGQMPLTIILLHIFITKRKTAGIVSNITIPAVLLADLITFVRSKRSLRAFSCNAC